MIRTKNKKLIAVIEAFLMVCLFLLPSNIVYAKDSFIAGFEQTVLGQNEGLDGSEINCLYQSSSGYIWVGTKSGLYRSNGQKFQSINLWDTDQSDVYSINCIYQDSKGRVWVGTDNYGLFYIENGENHHLLNEYYEGIKTIYDICGNKNGQVYFSTSEGLFTESEDEQGNISLEQIDFLDNSDIEFEKITIYNENVWVLYNNKIYIVKKDKLVYTIDCQAIVDDDVTCIETIDNCVFVGTSGNKVIKFSSRVIGRTIDTNLNGINSIMCDSNGKIWICADNGIGYINSKNNFIRVNDLEIDSYITDMIQDYEGNYWISSSRMGLLYLSNSKFNDFNIYAGLTESITNCVYTKDGQTYIGTDDGLVIYDSSYVQVDNDLAEMLAGTSVRQIVSDAKGNMWIATYRRYGVVRVSASGVIENISRTAGLPSMIVNSILPLSNGNIAVATDEGVALLDSKGNVKNTYEKKNGLTNCKVTSLYQFDDDNIFVGTDGGGIYDISLSDGKISNYTIENGLNSNTISVIKEGKNGLWIGTDNGLCFFNDTFRSISNIEYSNSIYDLLFYEDKIWIVGSKGVLCSDEEELLGSQGLTNRYFDISDGLNRTINPVGHTVFNDDGLLYICCNSGLYTLDINNIPYNMQSPKIRVYAVDVDGVRYEFDDLENGLTVEPDTSRITISFAVFSYSNRENMKVEYSLAGFDESPIVLNGTDNMEAVYTNLDGGNYEFVISATNGDGVPCESNVAFSIVKKNGFLETPIAIAFMLFVVVGIILLLIFAIIKIRKTLNSKNTALEQLSKEHEVAVKSSSAKNDYLAAMSNDIKTPVNAIMVKSNELLHIVDEDNPYRNEIENIYDIGKSIVDKVDDIILLAKIESGKIDVIETNYTITDMLCEISETAIQKIDNKGIKFFVEVGDPLADNVTGDFDKIKDILNRIVDNAIKYTKEGSVTLAVDCYELSDKSNQVNMANYNFTVSDTGNGIPENRIDDLFEVYNIVDNKKNNYQAKSGMGLAIAKGYADLLGADIQVESVYGAGSTFTLSINQKVVGNTAKAKNIAKIDETVSQDDADKLWLPDVNALLVDDEEISREVSLKVLSQFEIKVDVAVSGISAIDMVINNDYDIVLMDLSMSVMSGLDAMKEIRDLDGDEYYTLPIIALDTDAIDDDKSKLLEAGFTDSVVKPIDKRRLAAILKDCLPGEKIKEKATDIEKYIMGSRFSEGMLELDEYMSVESAIEKIGGSIEVFNKLINAYYNQNKNAPDELLNVIGKDMRTFKTKIHTLKTMSQNIGAYAISQQASKIEAAINIGNRDYAVSILDDFTIQLSDTINALERYLEFVDSMSGITDEEYAARRAEVKNAEDNAEETKIVKEKSVAIEGIDVSVLETIKYAALENDLDTVYKCMDELMTSTLKGEDKEFMQVLKEAVDKKEIETITELIGTYMDLKM